MISALYAGLALVQIALSVRLARSGLWLPAAVGLGIAADSAIIASGRLLGEGPALEALSVGRFALHAVLTPLLIVHAATLARHRPAVPAGVSDGKDQRDLTVPARVVEGVERRGPAVPAGVVDGADQRDPTDPARVVEGVERRDLGVPARMLAWVARRGLAVSAWVVAGVLITFDVVALSGLRLEPRHWLDTLRYVDAEPGGPPVAALVTTVALLAAGLAIWRRRRRPWLALGAIALLTSAGAAVAVPILGNLGEAVLLAAMAATGRGLTDHPGRSPATDG
ncbi:hypothetical protein ACIBG7_34255 [Nonomuraea sp. NPDC050328]|uniref:hypothetical protein n=1 Tax=Nonomuraea sp. NPDC050328 TaxID=3364361 RepID=UPI0037986DFB